MNSIVDMLHIRGKQKNKGKLTRSKNFRTLSDTVRIIKSRERSEAALNKYEDVSKSLFPFYVASYTDMVKISNDAANIKQLYSEEKQDVHKIFIKVEDEKKLEASTSSQSRLPMIIGRQKSIVNRFSRKGESMLLLYQDPDQAKQLRYSTRQNQKIHKFPVLINEKYGNYLSEIQQSCKKTKDTKDSFRKDEKNRSKEDNFHFQTKIYITCTIPMCSEISS